MKRVLLALAAILAVVGINVSTVFAWTYSLQGKGECQTDGSFKITWTVTNPEAEALQITSSSNPTVVPVGTQIQPGSPPPSSENFIQTADGTKPGSFNLSLTGHFKSDETNRTMAAKVDLTDPCTQPTPPTTGGQGASTPAVLGTTTTAVSAPVGAVSAGGGGAVAQLKLANLIGIGASLVVVVVGLYLLRTRSFELN